MKTDGMLVVSLRVLKELCHDVLSPYFDGLNYG